MLASRVAGLNTSGLGNKRAMSPPPNPALRSLVAASAACAAVLAACVTSIIWRIINTKIGLVHAKRTTCSTTCRAKGVACSLGRLWTFSKLQDRHPHSHSFQHFHSPLFRQHSAQSRSIGFSALCNAHWKVGGSNSTTALPGING